MPPNSRGAGTGEDCRLDCLGLAATWCDATRRDVCRVIANGCISDLQARSTRVGSCAFLLSRNCFTLNSLFPLYVIIYSSYKFSPPFPAGGHGDKRDGVRQKGAEEGKGRIEMKVG